MRGLKSFGCAKHSFPALDVLQINRAWLRRSAVYRGQLDGGRSYVCARRIAGIVTRLGRDV